jgi:hypothetical protein
VHINHVIQNQHRGQNVALSTAVTTACLEDRHSLFYISVYPDCIKWLKSPYISFYNLQNSLFLASKSIQGEVIQIMEWGASCWWLCQWVCCQQWATRVVPVTYIRILQALSKRKFEAFSIKGWSQEERCAGIIYHADCNHTKYDIILTLQQSSLNF